MPGLANKPTIPIRIGNVYLYSKGLVLVKLNEDHEITVEDVQEQVEAAVKLAGKDDFVVILDGGLTIDVSDKAMTYAAKFQNKQWLAFAIIVRSISERLFANYYLRFKGPVRPTQVFTTPKGAEEWIRKFIPVPNPIRYEV